MEILAQRVDRLEQDTAQIKIDLALLTQRSENFATKTDLAELRTEMHQGFGEIRKEMGQFQTAIVTLCNGMNKEVTSLQQNLVGVHREMAGVHKTIAGLHQNIAGLHQNIAGVHKDVAGLHKEVASQNRWVIGTIIGVAALCMTAAKLLF